MVKDNNSKRELLYTLAENEKNKLTYQFLLSMSYEIHKENGEEVIYPYWGNELDFLKEYYQIQIQQCQQKITSKKLKRLRKKLEDGNKVFVRIYDSKGENLLAYEYLEVINIRRVFVFFWEIQFANKNKVNNLAWSRVCNKFFRRCKDWNVYEDINFRKNHTPKEEGDPFNLYVERNKNRLMCICQNKRRGKIPLDNEVIISDEFLDNRKQIYDFLINKNKDKEVCKLLKACIEQYQIKRVKWDDLYKCFDMEYLTLKRIEEMA